MLKVVIADDEIRICKLIQALINWEALSMEIVGVANNGPEAITLIKKELPDILITDIRMPGCDGLALIEKVKEERSDCEIIIVSGYAHFEYAQSAIKYGVGDYLLKPINQMELHNTLIKLKKRINERQDFRDSIDKLVQKSENRKYRLQMGLMEQLLQNKAEKLTMEILHQDYNLEVKEGWFQAFITKIDGSPKDLSDSVVEAILERTQSILQSRMQSKCHVSLFYKKSLYLLGIVNYELDKAEAIKKAIKASVSQLEVEKGLYGNLEFTVAIGSKEKDACNLNQSVGDALLILKERLLEDSGRILEKRNKGYVGMDENLLKKYSKDIAHAIEILSPEEAEQVTNEMEKTIKENNLLSGQEIWELILRCGKIFLCQIKVKEREMEEKEFECLCDYYGNVSGLIGVLRSLQRRRLEELIEERDDEVTRPIRIAKQYIQKHYREPITMEIVCAYVGLSANYFSVLFKKTEGEGFAKYLIHLRMEEAKRLLRESHDSVANICNQVGYSDLKHFVRTFEKITGVKPAVYRKLYG